MTALRLVNKDLNIYMTYIIMMAASKVDFRVCGCGYKSYWLKRKNKDKTTLDQPCPNCGISISIG